MSLFPNNNDDDKNVELFAKKYSRQKTIFFYPLPKRTLRRGHKCNPIVHFNFRIFGPSYM